MTDAQSDRIIADIWMPDAVQITDNIRRHQAMTQKHIEDLKGERLRTSARAVTSAEHFQPEKAPTDWAGIIIAAVIVLSIVSAVVIGSTIDYRGM